MRKIIKRKQKLSKRKKLKGGKISKRTRLKGGKISKRKKLKGGKISKRKGLKGGSRQLRASTPPTLSTVNEEPENETNATNGQWLRKKKGTPRMRDLMYPGSIESAIERERARDARRVAEADREDFGSGYEDSQRQLARDAEAEKRRQMAVDAEAEKRLGDEFLQNSKKVWENNARRAEDAALLLYPGFTGGDSEESDESVE